MLIIPCILVIDRVNLQSESRGLDRLLLIAGIGEPRLSA